MDAPLSCNRLVIILIRFVVHDVVEAKLVDTLCGRNDTQPIPELLLLEVLLGAVAMLVLNAHFLASGATYRYFK
jgi:hypothetical protein